MTPEQRQLIKELRQKMQELAVGPSKDEPLPEGKYAVGRPFKVLPATKGEFAKAAIQFIDRAEALIRRFEAFIRRLEKDETEAELRECLRGIKPLVGKIVLKLNELSDFD